jgi:protein CpxP
MFYSFRPNTPAAVLMRSVAFVALMSATTGAMIVAGSFSAASAESAASTASHPTKVAAKESPAIAAATATKPDTVEQRIANLHAALKITPDEESNWNGVALAMRSSAADMQKLYEDTKAVPPKAMTAVEDLDTYEKFSRARLDGLKGLISAFGTLYSAMPPAQQKVADEVFQRSSRERARSQG